MKKEEIRIAKVEFEIFTEFRKTELIKFRDYVELEQYITERLSIYADVLPIGNENIRAVIHLDVKYNKNKKYINLKN